MADRTATRIKVGATEYALRDAQAAGDISTLYDAAAYCGTHGLLIYHNYGDLPSTFNTKNQLRAGSSAYVLYDGTDGDETTPLHKFYRVTSATGSALEWEEFDPGLSGEKGDDGFSPSASVKQLSDGAEIEITDKSGTTKATVKNVASELIPSVSKYQSGTVTIPSTTINGHGFSLVQVTLDEEMPDTDYCVVLKSTGTIGVACKVAVDMPNFTKTGFYLAVTNPSTEAVTVSGSVTWQAFKLMTDAALLADEAQIEQNKADIAALKSGKQDALTVTAGTWTRNATYATGGTFSWRKYGRLVIVTLSAVKLATWTDGDKVLSTDAGPKPMVHSYGGIPALNATTPAQLFAVSTDGKVMANGGVSHPGEFYGSFCYIAAE